jgi:hypothetical protein
MAEKSNRNKYNKFRPAGLNLQPIKQPTEGMDAHGRESQIVKDESPTRIDEVNDSLYYLGWAEYGASENDAVWKIRRITLNGTVWEQKYADGEQFYRHKWSERSILNYY